MDFPSARESRDEVKHGKPVLYIATIVVRRFSSYFSRATRAFGRRTDYKELGATYRLGRGGNLRAETAIGLKPPLAVIKAGLRFARAVNLSLPLVLDLDPRRFD